MRAVSRLGRHFQMCSHRCTCTATTVKGLSFYPIMFVYALIWLIDQYDVHVNRIYKIAKRLYVSLYILGKQLLKLALVT